MAPLETKPPLPNVRQDAARVFRVLLNGGLAIIPLSVGYAITATDPAALQRAFETKQRKPHKRHAMIGTWETHRQIHVLPEREESMVDLLINQLDLPLGVIAPFRREHPLIQKLGEETLKKSSLNETLSILINGGPLHNELARMSLEAGVPLMGSSANMTGKGTKASVEDIEPEILAVADIVIDYGKQKFNTPRTSSTMINFTDVSLVRYGACYDTIKDVLHRFYGIELPEDPGKSNTFSGHVNEDLRPSS